MPPTQPNPQNRPSGRPATPGATASGSPEPESEGNAGNRSFDPSAPNYVGRERTPAHKRVYFAKCVVEALLRDMREAFDLSPAEARDLIDQMAADLAGGEK